MPTAQVFDAEGKGTGTVELPAAGFGIKPHAAVVHEVLIAQLANRRAGTGATKTRGEGSGSTRKIWRQKGTGRARHGSRKAPIFVGGGIGGGAPRTPSGRGVGSWRGGGWGRWWGFWGNDRSGGGDPPAHLD